MMKNALKYRAPRSSQRAPGLQLLSALLLGEFIYIYSYGVCIQYTGLSLPEM